MVRLVFANFSENFSLFVKLTCQVSSDLIGQHFIKTKQQFKFRNKLTMFHVDGFKYQNQNNIQYNSKLLAITPTYVYQPPK